MNGGRYCSRPGIPWKHGDRVIDSTELILVTEGEVCMFIGDVELTAGVGDVLRIPPDTKHGGTRESLGVSFFWLHFIGAEESELPPVCFRPQCFDRALFVTRELLHYAETEDYPEECADSMMKILLAELCRADRSGEGSLVREIRELLRRECSLTVTEIARRLGYNEDYLNRAFKARCGTGLKKYADTLRLERIKRDLLSGELSLLELSSKYGFSEYKYFLKFFKYHSGLSPTKYREAYYNLHTN